MSETIGRISALWRPLTLLFPVALFLGCATAPMEDIREPDEKNGQVITREEIERSGARDGWEALRRGGTKLNIQYPREGSPARVTHRGTSSLILHPNVLLVVDGTYMKTIMHLRDIPANSIEFIQVLSARAAMVKYGTPAGNGAVVVSTNPPPPRGF